MELVGGRLVLERGSWLSWPLCELVRERSDSGKTARSAQLRSLEKIEADLVAFGMFCKLLGFPKRPPSFLDTSCTRETTIFSLP